MLPVLEKHIQLHQTQFFFKQFVCHKFLKMSSPEATKDDQQNGKKLGRKDNQRSGTVLFQTKPRFSFPIVVVKEDFALIKLIFLISNLAETLIYSKIKHR